MRVGFTGHDLFGEEVLFVEEEYDGDGAQPPVVPNRLEQVEAFAEAILRRILAEDHVVRAARRHEDDRRHVVEALDPFPSFVPLTSHIEHTKKKYTIKRTFRQASFRVLGSTH